MPQRKSFFTNRFFVKMMLTYCLVILLGLGLDSYFTASWMTNILTDKESQIDQEIVQQVKTYSDDKYKAVQKIFARLYMPLSYYNNRSIMEYINPRKLAALNRDAKNGVISSYLQDTCNANDFIADLFIVDYGDRAVFFTSSVASRDVSLDYDFFAKNAFGDGVVNNKIKVLPNHIPDYISASSVNKRPVISFYIYLFDENALRFDKPLGFVVINVWADYLKVAYRDDSNLNGTVYALSPDGLVLFDSSGVYTGKSFPYARYAMQGAAELETNAQYVVNQQHSDLTDFMFLHIVDRRVIGGQVSAMRRSIYGVIVACVVITLLISILAAALFSRRIRGLVRNMQYIEQGKFDTRIAVRSNDEIGYLEHSFNVMSAKLEEYIQNVYVFQLKTKSAELKSLQAQINPHFLFNTLESIRMNALINKDAKTAKMIHILGSLFRWNIKTKGMFVDLREELDYAGSYIELQKLRYDDAFELALDIRDDTLALGVPKLILQPLVENAISHGLSGMTEGGVIRITSALGDAAALTLTVSDNGRGMDEDTIRRIATGLDQPEAEQDDQYNIGLSNVHQRIRILFGEGYGLSVSARKNHGTTVEIKMPAMSKEELSRHVPSGDR